MVANQPTDVSLIFFDNSIFFCNFFLRIVQDVSQRQKENGNRKWKLRVVPWVSEGHRLCHVAYMLTQKEGQGLAMRSLGLM